jgi:Tfp pilus assembly protein PilW
MSCTVRHKSSGKANANAVDVAGVILTQILAAEKVHKERQIPEQVRVKIDSIGVGWGVASVLKTWGSEQRHNSKIVAVNVAERARDSNRFMNQRAEMWWNARNLLQPKNEGMQDVRLDIDHRCAAQMTGPTYASDSSGRIKIESKADMKRRGIPSPDRAEAILLCLYNPPGSTSFDMASPISIVQDNKWGGLGSNI